MVWNEGILFAILLWTLPVIQGTSLRKKANPAHLQVKLIDGESLNEGFVVVQRHQQWFYQCEQFWGTRNSKVVCRELRFTKVVVTRNASTVNKRMREIGFDSHSVNCESNEHMLVQCGHQPLKERVIDQHCTNNSRVYVVCHKNKDNDQLFPIYKTKELQIRLNNNNEVKEDITKKGVLQVLLHSEWQDVCADGWSYENSLVACKQLGFSSHVNHSGYDRNNIDTVYFQSNLSCYGTERTLWECQENELMRGLCTSTQTIQLECLHEDNEKLTTEKNEVRLRGGYMGNEGRVEIFSDGEWGTICDDGWDINDAAIVCRQLGFGSPYEATHWADHGEGIGKITLTRVSCQGNESSIVMCEHSTNTSSCTHTEDAGVRCRFPAINTPNVIRIVGGNNHEGRIDFLRNGRWDGICGIGFTRREGQVVCRQLGLGFVEWASRSYKYGVNYRKAMFNVRCHGNETDLLQCEHKVWGRCRYYDMASVKCSKYAADLVMEISEFQKSIVVESHTLYQLKCSYEERCLAPIVDQFYDKDRMLKRKLLKFTSSFMNKGAVSFRSHLAKDAWKWHKCHNHYHSMETFATYDLIAKNGTRVADGHKASFCLEDTKCDSGYKKHFNCTDRGDQGISVNCVDVYSNRLDCQWIDITEVKQGNYSLRVVVNPLRSVTESDYSNNRAVCALEYYDGKVKVKHCTTDACYQESFGGNSYGHCCTFPFTYKKKMYYTCSTDDEVSSVPWCSTTHDFDEAGRWGYCNEHV